MAEFDKKCCAEGVLEKLFNEFLRESRKKGVALGSPKSKLPILLLYSILVIEGVREGYLVDGIALSVNKFVDFISTLCSRLRKTPPVLIALESGDIIIANKTHMLKKCIDIFIEPIEIPTFIAVDICPSGVPRYLSDEELSVIRKAMGEVIAEIHCNLANTSSNADNPGIVVFNIKGNALNDVVSLPFFAGWLLGYPFVYRSLDPANCLSMIPLLKTSISCGLTGYTRLIGHSIGRNTIDLFEFTVPECLVPESSVERSFLSQWTERKIHEVNIYLDILRGNKELAQVIDSVEVSYETFILPQVML